jgi:hypothetical protein
MKKLTETQIKLILWFSIVILLGIFLSSCSKKHELSIGDNYEGGIVVQVDKQQIRTAKVYQNTMMFNQYMQICIQEGNKNNKEYSVVATQSDMDLLFSYKLIPIDIYWFGNTNVQINNVYYASAYDMGVGSGKLYEENEYHQAVLIEQFLK